jgi:hypothetical protein
MEIQVSTYRKLLFAALGAMLSVSPVLAQNQQQPAGPPSGPAPAREAVAPLAPDGTLGMALMSAVVNANATLVRGSGVVSVGTTGGPPSGFYEVVFDRNVTQCYYVANIGDPGFGVAGPGQTDVAQRNGNVNGVFVRTSNSAGTTTSLPFYLLVFCNK